MKEIKVSLSGTSYFFKFIVAALCSGWRIVTIKRVIKPIEYTVTLALPGKR